MICPNCSNENKESAKFCDECGYKFQSASGVGVADVEVKSHNAKAKAPACAPAPASGASPSASAPAFAATQLIGKLNDIPLNDKNSVVEGKTGSSSFTTPDQTQVINPYTPDTTGVDSMVDSPDYWGAGYTTQFPHISDDDVQKARVYKTDDEPSKKKRKKKAGKKSSMPVIPMGVDVSADGPGGGSDAVFSASANAENANSAYASGGDATHAGKKVKTAIISLVVVIIVAIVAFGTYQAQLWGGKVVPELIGLSTDESVILLQDAGFKVAISELPSDDVPGRVLYTHPSAGKRVEANSKIELQVAVERVVPDVMGKSEDEAKALFEESGYTNVEFILVKSEEVEGKIIAVDPEVSTPLTAASKITVSIADPYKVPDVIGLSEADAIAQVEAQGLVPVVEYIFNDNPENLVFEVAPAVGEILSANSEVSIKVAKSWSSVITNATIDMLYPGAQFFLDSTSVEVVSVDSEVTYVEGDTTSATVTVKGYASMLGELIYGTPKQYKVYFNWSGDATFAGAHT